MIWGIYLFLCANSVATIVAYYQKCYDSHSLCLITNTDEGMEFTLHRSSADRWCKDHSSSLATITNETVQSAIAKFINDSNALLVSDVITHGYRYYLSSWEWTNGVKSDQSHVDYKFIYGSLAVFKNRSSVSLYGEATYKRKFICSYNLSHSSDADCSNGYQRMGMICYQLRDDKVGWLEAINLCLQEEGSDLAVFNTGIPSLISTSKDTEFYWIGFQRSDGWAWRNTQGYGENAKYFNWDYEYPRSSGNRCLCLSPMSAKWTDCDCSGTYRYICIQALTPTITTTTTQRMTTLTTTSAQLHSTPVYSLDDKSRSNVSEDPLNNRESGETSGMLLGLGVGSACLLILIIVVVVVVCFKNRRSRSGEHEPTHANSPHPMTYNKDDAPNTVYAVVVPNDDQPARSPSEKTPNQTVYAELDLEPKGKISRRASQPVRYPSERTPDQSVYAEVDPIPRRKTLGRAAVGQQESDVYANSLQVDSVYANNAQTKV